MGGTDIPGFYKLPLPRLILEAMGECKKDIYNAILQKISERLERLAYANASVEANKTQMFKVAQQYAKYRFGKSRGVVPVAAFSKIGGPHQLRFDVIDLFDSEIEKEIEAPLNLPGLKYRNNRNNGYDPSLRKR